MPTMIWYKERFRRFVAKPFVQIMFGARQTGKSTLIKQVLPSHAQVLDLSQPEQRLNLPLLNRSFFLQGHLRTALRSGSLLNFQGMAKEVGVSGPTIQSYYQLLEDMYVGFSVPSLSGSAYKTVVSSHWFYFFDLGVRNAVVGAQVDESIKVASAATPMIGWISALDLCVRSAHGRVDEQGKQGN